MTKTVAMPNKAMLAHKAGMSMEEFEEFLEVVRRAMEPSSIYEGIVEDGKLHYFTIERRGLGIIQTRHGKFWQYSFAINDRWQKYSVLVKGDLDTELLIPAFKKRDQLTIRTDSGCETGQLFGDLTCECGEQLHLAMKTLEELGEGMIINIPHQDGRGMGLSFKLATLWIQDALGATTVESAGLLAPNGIIDVRTYAGVIGILRFFGIPTSCKINLATNNPDKARIFAENGYHVADYTPVVIEPTEHTLRHLAAKQVHLGHNGLVKHEG